MKNLLIILVAGLVSISAGAENWIDVERPIGENKLISIDLDTLKPFTGALSRRSNKNDTYLSILIRWTPLDDHINLRHGYGYSEDLMVINCTELSYAHKLYVKSIIHNQIKDWNKEVNRLSFVTADSRFSDHYMVKAVCAINDLTTGRTYN